jgi:hypothetical protein
MCDLHNQYTLSELERKKLNPRFNSPDEVVALHGEDFAYPYTALAAA